MAVPGFQKWFKPLLKILGDGESHKLPELYEVLANQLGLSPEDRLEMLPSGKQLTYQNRIGWARTYMKKAGLLQFPMRGHCQITELGRKVLEEDPEPLNVKYLKRFPAFVEFHTYTPGEKEDDSSDDKTVATPEEVLEEAHKELRDTVTHEILEHVKAALPVFFESLVVELLLRIGYGGSREDAGRTVGRSGDGGVDGIIKEDRLGLDVVYIQAKRWENTVGRPTVQAFAGSLEGFRARKGVMITTSTFSREAIEYVGQIEKRIVLVDGPELARLMFEHNLGVSLVTSYEVKRLDTDYFEDV